ncbi:MAG: ATP-binding protein [Balneolaceae bacterium]|nr:ATP-binding protein [Balneolaceae bacterium]
MNKIAGIVLFSVLAYSFGNAQAIPDLPKEEFITQQITAYQDATDLAEKYEQARQIYRFLRFEDLERARDYIQLTLEHARALEDPVRIIYAYSELGAVYSELGDFEGAFEEYSAAFSMSSVSGITSETFHTNYHLGKTYFDIQLPTFAEPLLRSAFENYSNDRNRWIPNYDLAVLYLNSGDTVRAFQEFEKLEAQLNNFENVNELIDLQYTILLAELMVDLGEHEKALRLMESRQSEYDELDLCLFNGLLSLNKSRIATHNNQLTTALTLANNALADFSAHKDVSYVSKTLLHLSEVHAAMGDYENSYSYMNEFHQHFNNALSQQYSAIGSRLVRESEAAQQAELELQRLSEILQTRTFYNVALLVLLLVVAVLFVILYRLYQKRKEITQQFQDLNTDKNHFIGVVSHDLRSPLNSVMVLSEFMKDDPDMIDAETAKEYGSIIYNSTQQMQQLLNNMLDVNKIESKTAGVSTEEIQLENILKSAYSTLSIFGKEKDIVTILDIEGELPLVQADESAVHRILENLVNNAYKFSPEGRIVKICAKEIGTQVEISVVDQGPGFTDLDKTKLFKKFEKLSANPTANEKSTGLGLYIVKNLVQQMNGTILVESEQGKGTTFKVLLNKA